MAKTTSQIIAENKIKRAEAAAIAASHDKIHQQQMAGVAEKNAARTLAVLNKAISGTSDSAKKSGLSRVAQMVTKEYQKASTQNKTGPKTAADMQKKKEDRIEEKTQVDSLQIKKDRAQKALEDFDSNAEVDWTDSHARKAHEAERERLQTQIDRAGAEIDARTQKANMDKIEAMSEEDRQQLRQLIESRDQRRSMYTNSITWFQEHDKENKNKSALLEKYSEEELAKLIEAYGRHLHEQEAEDITKQTQESVGKNWMSAAMHNVLAMGARTLGIPESLMGRLYEQTDKTGQYNNLQAYTAGDMTSVYGNTVLGATAQEIAGDGSSTGRNLLSIGYQGIVTLADSILRSQLGGGAAGGAGLTATGTFTQTLSEATKQGATPEQAVTLGIAKAGVEYLAEKISMDEMYAAAKAGDVKILKQAFKQAGIEIGTEELTLFGSLVAEAEILRENSAYKLRIEELVASGVPYEEAKAQADKEVLYEAAHTAAVSGFAGVLAGGGSAIVGNLTTNNAPEVTEEVQQEPPVQPPPEAPVVDEGQQIVDAVAAELAQQAPQPEVQPVSPEMEQLDMAVAETLGVQPAQQEAVDTAPETGYDNSTISVPGGQRNLTEQDPGIKGTGAAEGNFSGKPAYNATLSEDNAQADRRDDVRPMELPAQDINGGDVSAVTGNVYGSRVTPDDFASLMEEPTARGDFTYAKITNDQATQMATDTIVRSGTWENAYNKWKESVSSGKAGAEMSARGALFLNRAAQQGDKGLWMETLHYMQKLGTNTAQGLQAFRIIRTLNVPDKIAFLRMTVDDVTADLNNKYGTDIQVDQSLIDQYEQATTDEARNEALGNIQQNIADQIPSSWMDQWNALRYTNMLGNLKTPGRNIISNVIAAAEYRGKDTVGTLLEVIANKVSGGKIGRTKSLFVSKPLMEAGRKDFQNFKRTIQSGGKFGENVSASTEFEQGIQDRRRIFKGNVRTGNDAFNQVANRAIDTALFPMETYRIATDWLMNNQYFGDEAFGREAYARALAGYLQANGVKDADLSKVDSALLDKARAYAIREAQESTFHDNSAIARILSKLKKDTGVVGEGLMPFARTPANVYLRAEEFSPLGFINTAVMSAKKAKGNTTITGNDIINSLSKNLTGTALLALGALMRNKGWLVAGPDDEDEKRSEFDELNGKQYYAIQFPDGTNYTVDWATPASMTLFIGAELWDALKDDDMTFAELEDVFTSISDPMIQMSMLQGINDSLSNIKYSDDSLLQFIANAVMSYLTQGLTNTLMGQLERSTEETRQTTYIDKESHTPEWIQRTLGKASQKIPGWDYQQTEYLNAWGQNDKNEGGLLYNLLSPGYIGTEQQTAVTRELNRLRETTGENVFPQTVEKSVNFTDTDGIKHTSYNLSPKELETLQKVQGQTSYRLMFEVISNPDYAGLTDKQKAEVISDIYSYAREQGLREALPNRFSDAEAWIDDIQGDPENGLIRRATLRVIHEAIENTVNSIENDWSVSPAAKQNLDALYDSFDGLSKEAQKQILDDAVSDTAKYLEIRSHGINTEQYLDVVTDIKDQPLQKGYSQIRDAQTYHAIAENDSLSIVQKDYVMKAYMPDYDPNAKTVDSTELKYDYMIEEGYSRAKFATAYDIYSHEKAVGGEGTADRTRVRMCKELDIEMTEAKMLYKLFAGSYKPWE